MAALGFLSLLFGVIALGAYAGGSGALALVAGVGLLVLAALAIVYIVRQSSFYN